MEEGLSPTKISYEAGKRPKKAKRSGSGNYCCVAELQKHARPRLKQALLFFIFINPKKKKGMASKYIQISGKRRQR